MKLSDCEYYKTDSGILYCGDCLKILPKIKRKIDLVLTDPIWPGCSVFDVDEYKIFRKMYRKLPSADRIVIHLGCDSDIRFLNCIKEDFIRVIWLRYARPSYKGRILFSGDTAYMFGNPPKPIKGKNLICGEKTSTCNKGNKFKGHPCIRKIQHVEFLVKECSRENELILDPFLGSGTSAVAAEKLNRKWIGIEINEKYCSIAKERIEIEYSQGKLL